MSKIIICYKYHMNLLNKSLAFLDINLSLHNKIRETIEYSKIHSAKLYKFIF